MTTTTKGIWLETGAPPQPVDLRNLLRANRHDPEVRDAVGRLIRGETAREDLAGGAVPAVTLVAGERIPRVWRDWYQARAWCDDHVGWPGRRVEEVRPGKYVVLLATGPRTLADQWGEPIQWGEPMRRTDR